MIIVDTSLWVDLFNGQASADVHELRWLLYQGEAAVGDLILFEVLQGFRSDNGMSEARSLLLKCEKIALVTQEIALQAVDYNRYLRRRGITVRSPVDALIAAAVILGGHWLFHKDHDFDHFQRHLGLHVYAPMNRGRQA